VLVVLAVVLLAIAWLLFTMRLQYTVDDNGVTYRFIPLHFRSKHIRWDAVQFCYVRRYRPIPEYGGWGLRYGFRNGWAINVRGRMGLQLVMRSGKKVLIGTQRPDDLTTYLRSINKYMEP
jgi:hypothetical protein